MRDTAAAIMSAPFQDGGWDNALKQLASATRSSHMQVIGIGGANAIPFNWTTDCPDGFIEGFAEIDGANPDINWRIAASDSPLVVSSERDYRRVRKQMRCAIYDDFASHYDLPFGCQTVLHQADGIFIGMAALRNQADGCTTAADRAVFAKAAPHVLAAIRMQRAVEHQGAQMAAGMLESMHCIAFILDGHGRVGALTATAQTWLSSQHLLCLSRGNLWLRHKPADRIFQTAIARTLAHGGNNPERFWLGADDPARCEIFAVPRREWSLAFEPRALVVVRPSRDLHPDDANLLRSLLDLTGAEADIALRIGQGQSREAIAKARGAAPETVAAQLKAVFRKTGVHRESELVACLNKALR